MIAHLLLVDLIQAYKVYYILVTEILERFGSLSLDQGKKCFVVYQNFVNLTKVMKDKVAKIIKTFEFKVSPPKYYEPDESLVELLKICIDDK